MEDVVSSNIADAIGLGKPAIAEPDVAKKLFSGQFHSVLYNHLEDNYPLYVQSSMRQMQEAASSPLEETNGELAFGITDFSVKEEADKFRNDQNKSRWWFFGKKFAWI